MWCELILYPTTTATGTHDSTLSGRTAGWRALMKDTERPVERSKGCGAQATTRDKRNIYTEQLGSHSWSIPSTSLCQKVRFVELRLVPAFQIARAHHIGSVAYADGALSAHNTRSISMLRGQGSEARYHGTQVRAQYMLSRPGVGHLTRHCPPARCLRHHVKTVQAHREGFMRARSAANLSTGIAAATDPVVLVQPWLMTVAGWPVSIICAHLAGTVGGRRCTFAGCHRSTRWPSELVEGSLVSAQRAPEGS